MSPTSATCSRGRPAATGRPGSPPRAGRRRAPGPRRARTCPGRTTFVREGGSLHLRAERAGRGTLDPAMSRLPRIALAAAVLATMAATSAAAQEPQVPAGAVALVGDERIGKPEFRHWLRLAVRGDEQAKRAALRDSTMLFLLHRAWTRQEAEVRGIAVKRSRVRRAFERQRREAFPDERAFRAFLRESGMSEADLLERLEFDILQGRLVRAAAANVPAVSRGGGG